jgi:hypothetical protein
MVQFGEEIWYLSLNKETMKKDNPYKKSQSKICVINETGSDSS